MDTYGPNDPSEVTGEIFMGRACPAGCDGTSGLKAENASLRAALDEANAHLAWAREDGKRLQTELAQYKEATITQNYAIEQMLGMALYGKDVSGMPLWGDHTAESLAMEAVKAIARYSGEDMGEPNSYDSDGNPVQMKISGGAVLPSDADLLARAEKAEAELEKALFHERFANECLDTVIAERDAALREVKAPSIEMHTSSCKDETDAEIDKYPRPWRVANTAGYGPAIKDIRDARDGLVQFTMPRALAEFIVIRVNAGEKEEVAE